MLENKELFDTVEDVKSDFNDYFTRIGGKKFKQFYYDWHIEAMIAPFAELTEYFTSNFENPHRSFSKFSAAFKQNVADYNVDNPANSSLKCREFSVTKDGRLAQTIDQIETFGFEFRQFIYSFATRKDHDEAFGNWPIKTNMPYSTTYGLQTAVKIIDYLDKNFASLQNAADVKQKAGFLVDAYLRNNYVRDYRYTPQYTYESRRNFVNRLVSRREKLSEQFNQALVEYKNLPVRPQGRFSDTFQIETKTPASFGQYTPNGFELEFYVPEEMGDYAKLISFLKNKNGWKGIYTSNKDSSVYDDADSAGVIMRDESLARYNGLAAVEYASKIMRTPKDEEACLRLFDSFENGYANVHCSLHQHVSNQELDFDGYKRLVKRMMQFEKAIVRNFAAPERHDGKLLYATYISRNLSTNDSRDYPLLCLMTDMCDNKDQLVEMVSFGHKYKTLNIVPEHTVEFRFMNAHFNKEFVSAFLQFNRDMVNSAANNEGTFVNRALAKEYSWKKNRETDKKTVIKPLSYYYEHQYDSYRPQETVSKSTIDGEQKYAHLVVQALNETKKLAYLNPLFISKVKARHVR